MTRRTTPHRYQFLRRVEFSDTDAAGVTHFSRLLSFVEEAEHALFRELEIPVITKSTGWPRASLDVRFLAPCRFGDLLQLELSDFALEQSFLQYNFSAAVYLDLQPPPGLSSPVLRGTMRICHVVLGEEGKLASLPIPEEIASKLRAV